MDWEKSIVSYVSISIWWCHKNNLEKKQSEIIREEFGEKIDIQLDIDVELVDEFINSIKELTSGSAEIYIDKVKNTSV